MEPVRTEDALWAKPYCLEEPRSLKGWSCPLRLWGYIMLTYLVALPFWLFSLCLCLSLSPHTSLPLPRTVKCILHCSRLDIIGGLPGCALLLGLFPGAVPLGRHPRETRKDNC